MMSRYQIEPGRGGKDFVLVHGEPVGVITRQRHGNVYTCTIVGERQGGDGGECRPGSHPAWLVKRARAAGLVGVRALGGVRDDKLKADLIAARADVARLEAEYDALTRQNPLAVYFPSGEELLRAENKARRRLEQLEARAAARGSASRRARR